MKKVILIVVLIILVGVLFKVYSVIRYYKTNEEARIVKQVTDKLKKDKEVEIFDPDIIEKEIKPYNNCKVFDFSTYELKEDSMAPFKQNGELKKNEVDYKKTGKVDLNFNGVKKQDISITYKLPNSINYTKTGSFILYKNKKIFYMDKIYDYKVFVNRLMILYEDTDPDGMAISYLRVLNIFFTPNKKLIGVCSTIPKFCSTNTGIGMIREAKIEGSNYVWCCDAQFIVSIYRVLNSQYDYNKNVEIAKKNSKLKMNPLEMKLMWSDYDEGEKDHASNNKSTSGSIKAHDYINETMETDARVIINKLSD